MRRFGLAGLRERGGTWLPCAVLAVAVASTGCSDASVGDGESLGLARSGIINGEVDNVHDAVVAAFGQQSGCTATIIHVDGVSAYALSAAHCFASDPMQAVAVGPNYNNPQDVLPVMDYQVHPNYSPQSQQFDFAVMRLNGADASTPVIPAMRPADDAIVTGTILDHVGYGLISYPSGQSSLRHHVLGNANQDILGQLGLSPSLYIAYLQNGGSGPCSGDSGGPNLVTTPGGERVAGVISFGDQQCAQFGVSGRVSAVYDSFIAPYIGNPPPPDPSSSSSSGVGGATSSAGATVGAGGAGNHWTAGNSDVDDNFDGDVVSSGCALDARPRGGDGWLVLALGLVLGVLGRRRS